MPLLRILRAPYGGLHAAADLFSTDPDAEDAPVLGLTLYQAAQVTAFSVWLGYVFFQIGVAGVTQQRGVVIAAGSTSSR